MIIYRYDITYPINVITTNLSAVFDWDFFCVLNILFIYVSIFNTFFIYHVSISIVRAIYFMNYIRITNIGKCINSYIILTSL